MIKQDISAFFTSLQNLQTSQSFLKKCYANLPGVDPHTKSHENSGTFMYYLDQGRLFLTEGKNADVRLKPLLYFYGMGHMLKGCLLTNRPDYPESTSILAHGVSARKRKKKDYSFIQDEVRIQQNGLFTYTAHHLFALKSSPFTKVKMDYLLRLIPEMNDLFGFSKEGKSLSICQRGSTKLSFPSSIIDNYYLTERAFIQRISPYLPKIIHVETTKEHLIINLQAPIQKLNGPFYCHQHKHEVYFPSEREYFVSIPEMLLHYLVLYNLSMISRYETEYWGELFATKYDVDYSIIVHYLSFIVDKIELLLGEWLIQRGTI